MVWTPAQIEARLAEACTTLRRVPGGKILPAGMKANWPDFARSYAEAYGYDPARRPRVMASSEEIARMDETLGWIATHLNAVAAQRRGLPRDVAQIVWMRAGGVPWTRIMQHRIEWWGIRPTARGGRSVIDGGNSYVSIRKAHQGAIAAIIESIGGFGAPLPIENDSEPPVVVAAEAVEAGPVEEQRVVMLADEEGRVRPVVRTTHYRARSVIRTRPADE